MVDFFFIRYASDEEQGARQPFISDVPLDATPAVETAPPGSVAAALETMEQVAVYNAETLDQSRKLADQVAELKDHALTSACAAQVAVQAVASATIPVVDLTKNDDSVKAEPTTPSSTPPYQQRPTASRHSNSLRASPVSLGQDFWSEPALFTPPQNKRFMPSEVNHPHYFLSTEHRLLELCSKSTTKCMFHPCINATHGAFCRKCGFLRVCYPCFDHMTREEQKLCFNCHEVNLENQIFNPIY